MRVLVPDKQKTGGSQDYLVCLYLLTIPINQSRIRKVILALGINILVLVWFRSLLQYTFVFQSFEK